MLTASLFRFSIIFRTTLLVRDEVGAWMESVYVIDAGVGEDPRVLDVHGNAAELDAEQLATIQVMVDARRAATGFAPCSECGYENPLEGFKVPEVPGTTQVMCRDCCTHKAIIHALETGVLKLVPAPGCENIPVHLDPWDLADDEEQACA
jgi:hypothetical protein